MRGTWTIVLGNGGVGAAGGAGQRGNLLLPPALHLPYQATPKTCNYQLHYHFTSYYFDSEGPNVTQKVFSKRKKASEYLILP